MGVNIMLVLLIICLAIIALGFIMDFYAKKKGRNIELEQGLNNKNLNQHIHSEESIQHSRHNSNPHGF